MPTNIYLVNNSTFDLPLDNTISQPLDASDYAFEASDAPVSTDSLAVMWFDRNVGITKNETWIFSTDFTVDGVSVSLQEKLTGKTSGSTMWQRMVAGSTDTGFQDTNDGYSISFTGQSGAQYQLSWSLSGAGYQDITYTIVQTQAATQSIPPVMTQIETIVFLMLENRSLDHLLGWLHSSGSASVTYYPPGSTTSFDGIPAGASNSYHTTSYSPTNGTASAAQPCRVPGFDPNEAIDHVQYQLYADAYGNMPGSGFWETTPPMTGFAWDYYAIYDNPTDVMGAYSSAQLPVLYGLAENFAVSDRWFCSVPTQTDPNRAFSVCGTSLGAEDNGDIDGSTYANANTIFNVLGNAGKTWGMYWQSDNPAATGEPVTSWQPFTSYYFSQMQSAPNGGVYPYSNFLTALAGGTLPSFCFLEPYWGGGKGDALDSSGWYGIQGNDYHPPAWVGPAEAALNDLYNAIVSSPQWPNMLLIITFDEHGGTYDHVPPPSATPPDGNISKSGFAFDRLGVRVPTILVSPYVSGPTVFRAPTGSTQDFDHTSFLATFCKWAGIDPASANLGARVAVAPTFEGVLSTTPRTSVPSFTVPAGYAQQGDGVGTVWAGTSPLDAVPGAAVDVREFRRVTDETRDPREYAQRLRELLDR